MAEDVVDDTMIKSLLQAADDVGRGNASIAELAMQVKTSRYERTMVMKAWSQGTERSLIRIMEPAKDAGVATLKVEDNVWNYLPKVDRTMKVPAGMMSGSWMGSHFSNDDLVREVRLSEDYDASLVGTPSDNEEKTYVISLVPHEDVPVVWGKVVVRVLGNKVPFDVRYYDDEGELARTMRFEEPHDFGQGLMPRKMTLIPADKDGEFTSVYYREVDFETVVSDQMFSLQNLKK
jgi:hypothetical protein